MKQPLNIEKKQPPVSEQTTSDELINLKRLPKILFKQLLIKLVVETQEQSSDNFTN